MALSDVEITVISARDLKTLRTYAVAWINSNPKDRTHRTPVDTDNGYDPKWNHPMKFTLNSPDPVLEIGIYNGRDEEIGRASLPLNSAACRCHQLTLSGPSGRPSGYVDISVKTAADLSKYLGVAFTATAVGIHAGRILLGDAGGVTDLIGLFSSSSG